MGLILTDCLDRMTPIMSLEGIAPYLLDATCVYRGQGRPVFWYGMPGGTSHLHKRLQRGIYLWKEPVDGVLDWGEDSISPTGHATVAGFAGTRVISTVAREQIRAALLDLAYLHTLEQSANRAAEGEARRAATDTLDWVRRTFTGNWWRESEEMPPAYLDNVRRRVADAIERLTPQAPAPKEPATAGANRKSGLDH